MSNKFLKIHPEDNVLVALTDIAAGEAIQYENILLEAHSPIKAKHKVFIKALPKGAAVKMYGVTIGVTQCAVAAGAVVSTENIQHATETYSYKNLPFHWTPPDVSTFQSKTFKGFYRSDGRVGTANYWLFIPLVFCENRNLDVIKTAMLNELGYAINNDYNNYTKALIAAYQEGKQLPIEDTFFGEANAGSTEKLFKNVDGIKFLNHQGGCGGIRQDAAVLSKLLASYANHPNVGGVTVISLGCQNLQVEDFKNDLSKINPNFDKPLYFFEQQATESEHFLITQAIKKTFEGLIQINQLERKPAPLSQLCIGVKCGGSDGFSGISANPAVGYCSDLLVALGGKILLAEFPELCGAEQNLLDRMQHSEDAAKFVQLMQQYAQQAAAVGSGFDMNPSPGNIKDGLITDAMKSNGAAKKGGTAPIVAVLDYTEPAQKAGLNLVCTPGNDVEATTGQTASGATLILFTTGLGTPTGNPICPTIKLSTNTLLANKMKDIIDIDCGQILTGEKTIAAMGEAILEYCIKAASGEQIPKAVLLQQDDFIPWKRGISL